MGGGIEMGAAAVSGGGGSVSAVSGWPFKMSAVSAPSGTGSGGTGSGVVTFVAFKRAFDDFLFRLRAEFENRKFKRNF